MKRDDFVEVMGEGYQEHEIHNKRLPCETLVGETKKLYFKEAPVPASLSEEDNTLNMQSGRDHNGTFVTKKHS